MKQNFFTLLMLLALVFVAGSAMAQDKLNPYQGGTYEYVLPIGLHSQGAATVSFSNGGMSISGATTPAAFATIDAATTVLKFNVFYAETVPAGNQKIYLTLAANDGCSNNIFLNVTVVAKPTISLAVVGSSDVCPGLNLTPTDNKDATQGVTVSANTFTFTVTPAITPASGRTYDFEFDITPTSNTLANFAVAHSTTGTETGTFGGDYATGFSIANSTATTHTFTITFTTTEGVANTTYLATASAINLHVTAGGGLYTGTDASDNVIVKEIPTIGEFN